MKTVVAAWNRFWFAPGPASTLGVCRLLFFGALFVWQLPHDFSPWGGYSSVFWMPIWLFDTLGLHPLSPAALGWVQAAWKASLFLSAVGLFTRASMAVAFVLGTYLMGLPHNFGQTQHYDTLVVFACGALLLSRAADSWSIDALAAAARGDRRRPADTGEYTWPIRFMWVAMALAFGAAGIAKLRYSGLEWAFSDNLGWLLLRQQYHLSDGEPLTSWGIVVARHPYMVRAMAATALSIETLFPLTIFSRRARLVLVPAGLAFLVGIRTLMGPTFEQFMICYVFWVPWARVGERLRARLGRRASVAGRPVTASRLPSVFVVYDGGCGMCNGTVAVLRRLNLLGRLRFLDASRDWATIHAQFRSIDRGACLAEMHTVAAGRTWRGFDAFRAIAWTVPLGWFTLPLLYVPGVAQVGRRVYAYVAAHRSTTSCALPIRSYETQR